MAGNQNSGRHEFAPTDEDREKVRVLKAGGMSNDAIAEVIGISDTTLRKHFSKELDKATAKVRADLLMARYRAAMGGNVTAQNKMIEQVSAGRAQDRVAQREAKAPKIGKKEEQKAAAAAVSGKFAPPAPPKLVIDNR